MQRISPFVFAKAGRDRIQEGDEHFINTGVRFNFTRQGNLNIERARGQEAWRGRQFDVGNDVFLFANMQVVRWLNLFGGRRRSGHLLRRRRAVPGTRRLQLLRIHLATEPAHHAELRGQRDLARSLYERGPSSAFPNGANSPVRLEEKYRATNRGLFFKASYLRRF